MRVKTCVWEGEQNRRNTESTGGENTNTKGTRIRILTNILCSSSHNLPIFASKSSNRDGHSSTPLLSWRVVDSDGFLMWNRVDESQKNLRKWVPTNGIKCAWKLPNLGVLSTSCQPPVNTSSKPTTKTGAINFSKTLSTQRGCGDLPISASKSIFPSSLRRELTTSHELNFEIIWAMRTLLKISIFSQLSFWVLLLLSDCFWL